MLFGLMEIVVVMHVAQQPILQPILQNKNRVLFLLNKKEEKFYSSFFELLLKIYIYEME